MSSLVIEVECGTYTKVRHPHNGYYAGDFSSGPTVPSPAVAATESVQAAWDASRWLGPWTQ